MANLSDEQTKRLTQLKKKGTAKLTEVEADEFLFLDDKRTGAWPHFSTYAEFIRAKRTGTLSLGAHTKTKKGRERAQELTPERIEEMFLIFIDLEQYHANPTKYDKQHWLWLGAVSNSNDPYFAVAKFSPGIESPNARRYAYHHFIGLTDGELDAGVRIFQYRSCPPLCVNPHHMVKGSKTLARNK